MKCPKCQTDNPSDSKFCKSCATPLPADVGQISFTKTLDTTPDELRRGTVFAGRYEIIEELGAGGMGKVYRAFDKKLEEEVALKFLKPEIAADKRTVDRFRNEIKTARKIRHDHVCAMHDLHEEGKTLFITMEYVRGEDLKSVIVRMGTLTVAKAVSIARQVAEGLTQAHRIGVVHRDLKPGNIMIDKDGNAKIMDFGIARSPAGGGTTVQGAIIGTPEYMSPEQVDGKPADQRADVYALGVILFEMVTGRPPFEGETAFSIANKHKNEPAPDPRELNKQLPADLGRLILRCLEKEKEKRYQTTVELLSDLEAVAAALPATERPSSAWLSTRRKPSTSKTITVKITPRKLIIPAAALILLVAALIIWPPGPPEGGPPAFTSGRPSIAILNLANRTGQKDLDQYRDVLPSLISDDLSQSKYIYVVPPTQVNSILTRLGLLETDTFTTENFRAIGRAGVIKYLASGYYSEAGETFLAKLTIYEAESGRPISSAKEARCTSVDNFFSLADDLVLKIKPDLEMTAVEIANDVDSSYSRAMTSSIEAYQYYVQGQMLWRKGGLQEAIRMYERAVAIDPEFALACRGLVNLYTSPGIGRGAEAQKYRNKALELACQPGRLPLRDRLVIVGQFSPDPKIRLESLTRLLEDYPEDPSGNGLLGIYYGQREELEKAVERYEVLARNKIDNRPAYLNLADIYCRLGEYAKAENLLKGYLRDFPESLELWVVHSYLSGAYTGQAKYELALAEEEKILRLDPSKSNEFIGARGMIFHFRGKFDKAEAEFRMRPSDTDVSVHLDTFRDYLVPLCLTQGMFQKAKEILDQGIELANKADQPQRMTPLKLSMVAVYHAAGEIEAEEVLLSELWKQAEEQGRNPGNNYEMLWYKTELLIKKKSFEEARVVSDSLASIIEKWPNMKMIRIPLCLQGMIESEMGNQKKAIELLSRAMTLLPPGQGLQKGSSKKEAFFADPLALAYFRAGDLEKARSEYEEITRMTFGRYYWGDIYAKSFYMLGQVYEQMGKKKQARANYRKFLELWKNADPGRPEVEDAKKRLAAL